MVHPCIIGTTTIREYSLGLYVFPCATRGQSALSVSIDRILPWEWEKVWCNVRIPSEVVLWRHDDVIIWLTIWWRHNDVITQLRVGLKHYTKLFLTPRTISYRQKLVMQTTHELPTEYLGSYTGHQTILAIHLRVTPDWSKFVCLIVGLRCLGFEPQFLWSDGICATTVPCWLILQLKFGRYHFVQLYLWIKNQCVTTRKAWVQIPLLPTTTYPSE